MGGEVHSKAVAEQTGIRSWIKSGDKLLRTSLKIKETAALAPAPVGPASWMTEIWVTDVCIPFIS